MRIRKLLKLFWVIQEKQITKYKAIRINPYNPLSYISLAIMLFISLLWIGIEGIVKNWKNPFKWQ